MLTQTQTETIYWTEVNCRLFPLGPAIRHMEIKDKIIENDNK